MNAATSREPLCYGCERLHNRLYKKDQYIHVLLIERAKLQSTTRWLNDQKVALEAQLARQAVKDSMRDMEGQ